MIETLFGTLLGGVFRLVPELLKWLDRKNERAHELAMFDKQLQADQARAKADLDKIHAQADASIGLAEVQALIEATKAQAQLTGIKWVDAFNAAIRPTLALQWLIILWPSVVVAGFVLAILHGTEPIAALHAAFGVDEKALAASIASFFLLDRSLRKMGRQ